MAPKIGMKRYMQERRRDPEIRERGNLAAKAYQETRRGRAAKRAGALNASTKMRGGSGKVRAVDVLALLAHPECAHPMCLETEGLEVDHIVAVAFGGKNQLSNLCLLCKKHHGAKSRREREMLARGGEHLSWVADIQGVESQQMRLF